MCTRNQHRLRSTAFLQCSAIPRRHCCGAPSHPAYARGRRGGHRISVLAFTQFHPAPVRVVSYYLGSMPARHCVPDFRFHPLQYRDFIFIRFLNHRAVQPEPKNTVPDKVARTPPSWCIIKLLMHINLPPTPTHTHF